MTFSRKAPVLCLILMLSVLFSCTRNKQAAAPGGTSATSAAPASTAPLFTAYNLWYEKPQAMYSINYKKGTLIPAGTPVKSVHVTPRRLGRATITFTTLPDNRSFTISFQDKFHPNMDVNHFADRLFTTRDFNALTGGMTEKEVQSIKEGVVRSGMSKAAVLVAFGYPPEHRTPSLDNNAWIYWQDRFRTTAINFDESGRTTR